MIKKTLIFLFVLTVAGMCFLWASSPWWLAVLLVIAVATRLVRPAVAFGRLATMLFVFAALLRLMSSVGIAYPGALILVMTGLVSLIFFEGPEWSDLYFFKGKTGAHGRLALAGAIVMSLMFGVWIWLRQDTYTNPVALALPVDALIVVAVGFALYVAIVEESIFRSFILERVERAADGTTAVVAQGLLYGMMYSAMPLMNGPDGMLMGTVYGIFLGYLVKKSDSIYLSLFVHFVVSLVTFVELAILGHLAA